MHLDVRELRELLLSIGSWAVSATYGSRSGDAVVA